MKNQTRNQKCNCGSGKKFKYCCGNHELNERTNSDGYEKNYLHDNINAEHISYLGNTVIRNSSQILPATIDHFKQFQIEKGMIVAKIDKTPFNCRVTIKDGVAIFDLLRNKIELTKTICCFGQNLDLASTTLQSTLTEYSSTDFGKIYKSIFGNKITKPSLNKWLYTFITGMLLPSEALLAGEIEFYIYDAIRRGIAIDDSN